MQIKFGIVGCGYIAHRHAQHINNHPEAKLVAAFDIDNEKTQNFAQKYDIIGANSLSHFLETDASIVSVCTPNGTHHEVAIEVLKAKKHALVEKPMAIRKDFGENMLNAALDNGQNLFVVKQNRFNPPVQAVKKLMDDGKMGEIFSVVVNCFWNRNEAYYQNSDWKGTKNLDGGTLFTQFSHFIDILYYLLGDVEVLKGVVKNANHQNLIEFEDTGHFVFQFKKNNAIGSLNFTTCTFDKNMEGSITIFAENATIKIGGKYLNTIDFQSTKGFDITDLPTSNPANNYGYYEGSMSNHDDVINNVVQSLKGKETIMTNAYDGLKVVEIIEKFYDSAK